MRRLGLFVLITVVVPVLIWLAAWQLLDVQLPEPEPGRGAFPEPMDPDLPLRQAFDTLPSLGEGKARIRLLQENASAWAERWRLLENARERLDVSYFILKPDLFGMAFLGHLIKKAREGVEVRVLLDAMGTEMSRNLLDNRYLIALVEEKNITVRTYRPLRYRTLDAFLTLNPLTFTAGDHDKILLADDRWSLVGGRNISDEYFTPAQDNPKAFHDTDLVLFDPILGKAVKQAFEAQFNAGEAQDLQFGLPTNGELYNHLLLAYRAMNAWVHGEPIAKDVAAEITSLNLPWLDELAAMPNLHGALQSPPPPVVKAEARLLDSHARFSRADDPITRSLIRLVRSARNEIFIQSPYLVLTEEAVVLLEEAAARGLRITILTNSALSTDNALSQALFLEQWPALLARVPTLRLFVGADRHNLHGKYVVIDHRLSLVGTYNLDPISLVSNSEMMVAVWSESFAKQLMEKPQELIAANAPRVREYRIIRARDGTPQRDASGNLMIAFGPDEHLRPEQWKATRRYLQLVRGCGIFLRDRPFL